MLNSKTPPSTLYRGLPVPTATCDTFRRNGGSLSVSPHVDPQAINYARLAIEALVKSTRAFHGMDSTLTNVFRTARAQWGNLLTLAACYRDKLLCRFINPNTLSTLFTRTIAFFKMIAYPSSALINNINILIGLAKELGFAKDGSDIKANRILSGIHDGGP
ncbi:hypothetical protein F5Y15DRAFT_429570 [Xylariaceae sp. FL0016]|nr:hypothetical protein F5Y15DRAFT_429570 [Xylariaceae sp. FL0016]